MSAHLRPVTTPAPVYDQERDEPLERDELVAGLRETIEIQVAAIARLHERLRDRDDDRSSAVLGLVVVAVACSLGAFVVGACLGPGLADLIVGWLGWA